MFLSAKHWARYRWRHGIALTNNVRGFYNAGSWTLPKLRAVLGGWKLREVRNPAAKGKNAAIEVGRAAITLVRKHPTAAKSRAGRKAIYESLMTEFACSNEVIARGTTDAEYRAARKAIRRRLERAVRELGQPVELVALV